MLKTILEFRREEVVEEFASIEIAGALYELAALRLKRKSLSESLDNIEECIDIYQESLSRWKTESYKKPCQKQNDSEEEYCVQCEMALDLWSCCEANTNY